MEAMLNFLGVDSNFSVLAGQAWYCQFLFRDDTTGEPTNLDAVTFKGEISTPSLLPTKYAMEFTRSELDEQRNVVRVDIPALPEGRWRYTIMATDDGGNSRRLLYGFVTALGRIPDMNNGAYANRTLILRLPNDSGRKLQVEWAATTIAEFFARQSKQSAEEAAESAKQSEASAQRSETAAKQSEASAAAAKKSEEEALKSQQAARQSELNAATSAKQAAASATAADKSAQAADASAQLASSKADAASDSAARAKASETAAKKSAEAAAASQNAAKQSELEAKSSAENAKARATDAKNSAEAAAQSAQDAKDAADNTADAVREEFNALKEAAAQEAANAAQSAADSQSSADASADSAAASAQSAKDAAASATAAAGSATKAAGSASTAQSAAATAATDAANAAAKQTSDQLKAAVKADKDAAEAAAQRAEDAAANAAEVVGFDINDYTLKTDFQAHANNAEIHPTKPKQERWDNKLDEIDIKVRDGELQTFHPSMGAEEGDGVGRWIGIGQKDVKVTGDGDVWELVSVTIKCREAAYSGVGDAAYYLGVWEHVVGGAAGDFHRIATSENAVQQVLGQSGTWNFKKATIHHQDLRFAFVKEKDGVWPKSDWHLMGFRVAERTAESGNNTGAQSTAGTFDKTHVPVLTVAYAELKDKFETEIVPPIILKGTITSEYEEERIPLNAVYIDGAPSVLSYNFSPVTIVGAEAQFDSDFNPNNGVFIFGNNANINFQHQDNRGTIINGTGSTFAAIGNLTNGENLGTIISGVGTNVENMSNKGIALLPQPSGNVTTNGIASIINKRDDITINNSGLLLYSCSDSNYTPAINLTGSYGLILADRLKAVSNVSYYGAIVGGSINYEFQYDDGFGGAYSRRGLFAGGSVDIKTPGFSGVCIGDRVSLSEPDENIRYNNGVLIGEIVNMPQFSNTGIVISSEFSFSDSGNDEVTGMQKNGGILILGTDYVGRELRERNAGLIISNNEIIFPTAAFSDVGSLYPMQLYGNVTDAEGTYILKDGVYQDAGTVLYIDKSSQTLTNLEHYSACSNLTLLSADYASGYAYKSVIVGSDVSILGHNYDCVLIGSGIRIGSNKTENPNAVTANIAIGAGISGLCACSIIIGRDALVGKVGEKNVRLNSISIGFNCRTNRDYSIGIGSNAFTFGLESIAIGNFARIGKDNSNDFGYSIAIGSRASVTPTGSENISYGIAIGNGASVQDDCGIALGANTTAKKNCVAIGEKAYAPEEGVAVLKTKKGTVNLALYLFAPGTEAIQNLQNSQLGGFGFGMWEDGAEIAPVDIVSIKDLIAGFTSVKHQTQVTPPAT